MNAPRPLVALPCVELSGDDERAGRIAPLQAEASLACGPVLRATVPSGPLAGPCACLVGPEALQFAYGPLGACLGSAQGWRPIIGRRFGASVLNSDEPRHAAERRQWTPAFASRALMLCLAGMEAVIARRVARWVDAVVIDAYAAARELAFAIVAVASGGLPDDACLAELGSHFAEVLAGPRTGEDLASYHVRVLPLRDAIEHVLIESIEAARSGNDRATTGGLIALLLDKDPAADTASLLQALNMMLIAGHETTASLLAWILLLAADNPLWLERLAGEADALPKFPAAVDPGMLATMQALDGFIAEAGRLHPPLVNSPRSAMRDFDYAGVRIAAGTTVALAIGATHRSRDTYAEPGAFRPERFLADHPGKPMQLFTFGHGVRSCLGTRFAQIALKLTMTRLLQVAAPVRADSSAIVHAGFWNARPRGNLLLRLDAR